MDNYDQKRQLILTGNINKVILSLAAPIMFNNFIQTIYNLTDTLWISRLGGTQIAAMTLVWPVIFFILAIGIGISIAGTSLISQYTGADDSTNATRVAGQLLSFSLIFSILLGIIGYLITTPIVRFMGAEGLLLQEGSRYLKIMFLGMPTIFLFVGFTSIKQGQGDTITPMKYSAISVVLNMILDPIFIFTLNLGIGGAAIATVLSRGIFAVYAIYSLITYEKGIRLRKADLKLNRELLTSLIKIGLPSSVGQSTTALGFMVLNMFIISFGQSTLAAFGIGNRINSLILMPAMGIGSALVTIVGQNLGADQIKRAKKAVQASAVLTTAFMVSGGLIIYPFIPKIISFFTHEKEIAELAILYFRLITLSLPLMGFYQIFIGTFQGSGHTVMAMIIMMGRLWVLRIPMILLFKKYTNWGSSSVWYAMILSNAIITLLAYLIYLSGRWEKKVIKKRISTKVLSEAD